VGEERILAALGELRAEVAALRRAVEGRSDRPEIGALLSKIHDAVGERGFTGAELIDFCEVASATALLTAIVAACGTNPRRLGRLFRRIEGQAVGGFVVRRVDDSRAGLVWRVARVSGGKAYAVQMFTLPSSLKITP